MIRGWVLRAEVMIVTHSECTLFPLSFDGIE